MIIIGAGMNHWYHLDMNYRGVINMLMLCVVLVNQAVAWAHYVGQKNCALKLVGYHWRRLIGIVHHVKWRYEVSFMNTVRSAAKPFRL